MMKSASKVLGLFDRFIGLLDGAVTVTEKVVIVAGNDLADTLTAYTGRMKASALADLAKELEQEA